VEGALAKLSNDQQRSHAGHEPDQGLVSRMGHSLWRYTSLRSVPSFGMVEQDSGSRRAASRRALLRSEERRVGKEGRTGGEAYRRKKKANDKAKCKNRK